LRRRPPSTPLFPYTTLFRSNLIASHSSRTPRFSGSASTKNSAEELVDFVNNVIYNWGHNNVYGGEAGRYNVRANYYKPGPASSKDRKSTRLNSSHVKISYAV